MIRFMRAVLTCLSLTILFLTMLSLSSAAQAQDNPIVQRLQAFVTAFNAGDANAIAAFYTADGALLPPQAGIVSGHPALAAHYAAAFQAGVGNLDINILEIRGHGPTTAVEISDMTVHLNGRSINGRYLHVWVRVEDTWYLSRDMYHSR